MTKDADKKVLRIRFHGYVQGVGFRQAVKIAAEQLGLEGTVRNLQDGAVEVVALGTAHKLEELARSMQEEGPGRVFTVDKRWLEPKPNLDPGFKII